MRIFPFHRALPQVTLRLLRKVLMLSNLNPSWENHFLLQRNKTWKTLNLESGKKGAPAEPVGYWECLSFGPANFSSHKSDKRWEFEKWKELTGSSCGRFMILPFLLESTDISVVLHLFKCHPGTQIFDSIMIIGSYDIITAHEFAPWIYLLHERICPEANFGGDESLYWHRKVKWEFYCHKISGLS